ncbi:hypothetical protein [Nonomuraea sp. B19D2]|uniref:hypothetical protein n=1 Tax=Nonomuraea sp. B19D2 TaxID=3159561 RepID=UPI0032D9D8F8
MPDIWTVWDAELGYSTTSLLQNGGEQAGQLATHYGAEPMWGISRVRPDGGAHLHIIPHSTWEWRCAEYGIDPDDMTTLLDIVLHEPWIPDPDDALASVQPGAAAVLQETHGLPTCWTPGVPDADRLAAHLERIRLVKQHRVQIFEKTNGSTALILQRLDQVDDRHAELAQKVEQDRAAAEARYTAMEARLDAIEREAVTRTQLTERTKQIVAIVGLLVMVAAAVIALIQLTRG